MYVKINRFLAKIICYDFEDFEDKYEQSKLIVAN